MAERSEYNATYYQARKTTRETYAAYQIGPDFPGPMLAIGGQWVPVTTGVLPDGRIGLFVRRKERA